MIHRCPLARLREERVVLLGPEDGAIGRPIAVIVALDEHGSPHAYRNECMHIAIPLGIFAESILDAGTLLCGTHGARYRIEDGACFEGPCLGIPLERLPLVIEGDEVRVELP